MFASTTPVGRAATSVAQGLSRSRGNLVAGKKEMSVNVSKFSFFFFKDWKCLSWFVIRSEWNRLSLCHLMVGPERRDLESLPPNDNKIN